MTALLNGETLTFAYESVRLFFLCQGMQWAHLPVAGGIYDQHPMLIDEWSVLFQLSSEHQQKKEKEATRNSRMPNVPGAVNGSLP